MLKWIGAPGGLIDVVVMSKYYQINRSVEVQFGHYTVPVIVNGFTAKVQTGGYFFSGLT